MSYLVFIGDAEEMSLPNNPTLSVHGYLVCLASEALAIQVVKDFEKDNNYTSYSVAVRTDEKEARDLYYSGHSEEEYQTILTEALDNVITAG